jgi:hypothetical protein
MDQKQFDAMLSDGETRLTRLKMLYEQWFLGFERIEPAILRKEFEDLLAMLRREQVANTALRFRLQQLVQRHMTFATHWRRVARQIEDGTYQRDVLRARRLREQNSERDNAGPELEVSYDIDLDDELQAALEEVHRAAEAAAAKPRAAEASAAKPHAASAAVVAQAAPGRALAGAWAAASNDAPSAAGSGADSLPLAPAASAARSVPQRAISPFAMPAANGAKAPVTAQTPAPTATSLLGAIAAANGNGAKPANAARTAAAVAGGAGQSSTPVKGAAAEPTAAKAAAAQPSAAKAPAARTATAVGVAAAQPTAAQGATATAQAAAAPATNGATPKPAAAGAPKPTANGTASAAKPAASPTAGPAKPAAAAAPRAAATNAAGPKPAPAATSGSAALSNDDVQRIYTQYLSARKQNSERVDNVKLDSIEKTLRGMLPQLEKKHAGKKIDFEVVVKDGKVALKPVAR